VTIPKPDGGERELGVPTALDRLIQRAVALALTPIFDPTFSPHSYGFRPGRSAHQAVKAARALVVEGYTWVVDVDLERFFDRVQHEVVMARVARKVDDRRVLRRIRRYLEAGVIVSGVKQASVEGTPRGRRSRRCWPTSCSTTWTGSWSGGATGSSAMPMTCECT
jgi:retron-type reverse transcriptase